MIFCFRSSLGGENRRLCSYHDPGLPEREGEREIVHFFHQFAKQGKLDSDFSLNNRGKRKRRKAVIPSS